MDSPDEGVFEAHGDPPDTSPVVHHSGVLFAYPSSSVAGTCETQLSWNVAEGEDVF